MSKYDIAIFIVCSIEGFICYLIGYKIGITHEKRTNTHECVKDTHDKTEPTISKMEQVDKDINVRSKDEPQACDTCKWGERYRQGYDITMMDDECGGCCSWNSKWTPKTEQTERSE